MVLQEPAAGVTRPGQVGAGTLQLAQIIPGPARAEPWIEHLAARALLPLECLVSHVGFETPASSDNTS